VRSVTADSGNANGVRLRPAVSALRRRIRLYRDEVALRRADERFSPALELALTIEGFTSPVELSLLYHLALLSEGPGEVVELGSYLGRSTVVLAKGVADAGTGQVVAVDPHTSALGIGNPRATDEDFVRNMERCRVAGHVEMMRMTSAQAASRWRGDRVRMLFVDAWHSYDAVLEDVTGWAPFLTPRAAVVFDDYPHPEVRAAVRRLVADRVVGGTQLIVGKMIAFAPKPLASAVPCPPGASMLPRLGGLGFSLAFRWKQDAVPPEMRQFD
jgi:predicted O-methyltransferase YrrM